MWEYLHLQYKYIVSIQAACQEQFHPGNAKCCLLRVGKIDSIRFASLGCFSGFATLVALLWNMCVFLLWFCSSKILGENPEQNPTFFGLKFVCFHPFWAETRDFFLHCICLAQQPSPTFLGFLKKKVQQNPTKFLSPRCSREGPSVTLDPYPAAMGPTSPIVCRTRRDFRLVQVNPVRPRVMDFHHGNLRAPPECLPPPPRNKSRPYYGTVNH